MLPLQTKERHTNRLLASLAFPSLRLHLVPLPLHSSGSGNITKLTTQINITVFQRAPANTKEREINTSHFLVQTTSKLHLLHVITTQLIKKIEILSKSMLVTTLPIIIFRNHFGVFSQFLSLIK